jgi:hypothetical protein
MRSFTIRERILLAVTVALALGWLINHGSSARRHERQLHIAQTQATLAMEVELDKIKAKILDLVGKLEKRLPSEEAEGVSTAAAEDP